MPQITIGTSPKIILNANSKRRRWHLVFYPNSVVGGNAGNIFIARGYQPSANTASVNWDEIIPPGGQVGDNINNLLDESPWKGSVWARAANAGQVCSLVETINQEIKKETE